MTICPLVFILPVIRFDKSFYPVVLYEHYLICVLININENVKCEWEIHWINL